MNTNTNTETEMEEMNNINHINHINNNNNNTDINNNTNNNNETSTTEEYISNDNEYFGDFFEYENMKEPQPKEISILDEFEGALKEIIGYFFGWKTLEKEGKAIYKASNPTKQLEAAKKKLYTIILKDGSATSTPTTSPIISNNCNNTPNYDVCGCQNSCVWVWNQLPNTLSNPRPPPSYLPPLPAPQQ